MWNIYSQLRFDGIAKKSLVKPIYSTSPISNRMRRWFGKHRSYCYRQWFKRILYMELWWSRTVYLSSNNVVWRLRKCCKETRDKIQCHLYICEYDAHPFERRFRQVVNTNLEQFNMNSISNQFFLPTGGPLVRRSNGSLIGVTSFVDSQTGIMPFEVNAFSKVHLFYDWMSEVTGLDLPKCSN